MSERYRLADTPDWRACAGADWPWLHDARQQAFRRFLEQGVPDRDREAWKYTATGDLSERAFATDAGQGAEEPTTDAVPEAHRLLFRNGRFCADESHLLPLPDGAQLLSLREAIERRLPLLESALGQIAGLDDQPFAALNAARFDDGLVLHLAPGCVLEQPLYCRFESDAAAGDSAGFPRLLLVLEAGSQAQLLEEHSGSATSSLTDLLTEIRLDRDAQLFHGRLFDAGLTDTRISGIHVQQAAGSRYHNYLLALGAGLGRNDLNVTLEGEAAEAILDGLYLLSGSQHLDNHLRVDHRQPGGRSDQFYKGILDGRARAVFNGLAVVHPDAQRSDARQINRNLLLSASAEVDTKPELQIEADDVKCSHGATVGYLDAEPLFYLRSRGIDEATAKALLIEAFARETLARVPQGAVREHYAARLNAALNAHFVPQVSGDKA